MSNPEVTTKLDELKNLQANNIRFLTTEKQILSGLDFRSLQTARNDNLKLKISQLNKLLDKHEKKSVSFTNILTDILKKPAEKWTKKIIVDSQKNIIQSSLFLKRCFSVVTKVSEINTAVLARFDPSKSIIPLICLGSLSRINIVLKDYDLLLQSTYSIFQRVRKEKGSTSSQLPTSLSEITNSILGRKLAGKSCAKK